MIVLIGANIFSNIGNWFVNLLKSVILLLPDSPFLFLESDAIPAGVQAVLPFVNWFIPVGTIMTILETWLTAILLYYAYQVVLRWVKAIE